MQIVRCGLWPTQITLLPALASATASSALNTNVPTAAPGDAAKPTAMGFPLLKGQCAYVANGLRPRD